MAKDLCICRFVRGGGLGLICLVGDLDAAPAQPAFQGLGDLGGGVEFSTATDVTPDGSVVVGWSESANGPEAFRWSQEDGMTGLGDLAGGLFRSKANAISANGLVIVGTGTSDVRVNEAFRWTEAGGMEGLGSIPCCEEPVNQESRGLDVSADGSVVVGESEYGENNVTWSGFRWSEVRQRMDLTAYKGDTRSVSHDGTAMAGNVESQGTKGYYSTGPGSLTLIFDDDYLGSDACCVSADGSTVVGWAGFYVEAIDDWYTDVFRWTEAGGMEPVGLALPPGPRTEMLPLAVSADATVILLDTGLWQEGVGFTSLAVLRNSFGADVSGWSDLRLTGLSDDGQWIIGEGTNPSGHTEAWIAPVPDIDTSVQLSASPLVVAEGGGTASVTLSIVGVLGTEVTVAYETLADSAEAGADFTPVMFGAIFDSSALTHTVEIPIHDDGLVEGDEEFVLRVSALDGPLIPSEYEIRITIRDGGPGYDGWGAQGGLTAANGAPDSDWNGDGFANLHNYGFGVEPDAFIPVDYPVLVPRVVADQIPDTPVYYFGVPEQGVAGVTIEVEESHDGESWTVIATKTGDGTWVYSPPHLLLQAAPENGFVRTGITGSKTLSEAPFAAYRVRVRLAP